MEVLQAFDVADNVGAGLTRFRKWLDGFDPNDLSKHSSKKKGNTATGASVDDVSSVISNQEQIFHKKHHTARTRWIAPKNFPDAKVLNAYLKPVVDTSRERFTFGIPDLDGLINFSQKYMGLTSEEISKAVLPVIQKMEESSMRQTRIDSFMRYEDGIKFANVRSKRLRDVLGLSTRKADADEDKSKRSITLSSTMISKKQQQQQKEAVAAMDIIDTSSSIICENKTTTDHKETDNSRTEHRHSQLVPKKRYNGKKTLAALSSASASTTVIAISSKSDNNCTGDDTNILPDNTNHRNQNINKSNLPKTAPPGYQKRSSVTMEDKEQEQADNGNNLTSETNYEVINPSMII